MNVPVLKMRDATHVSVNGKDYLFFGGYDYHRLSRHPKVVAAIRDTLKDQGLNCSGSRVTTGTHQLHLDFESLLADFLGCEAAALLPSGYMANLALFEALSAGNRHYFFHPECHPSLQTAMRLSALPRTPLRENTGENAELIRSRGKSPLIVTDGIYESLPPLREYYTLAESFDGMLLIDEAHALGILGNSGRGAAEHFELPSKRLILSGSLCKGPGVSGGFVAGPGMIIDRVRSSCTYSTTSSVTLPLTAAAIASVKILREHPEMIRALQQRALAVKKQLTEAGWPLPLHPGPVIALYPQAEKSERLFKDLEDAGIYPCRISYYGKPDYFRFALSSAHSDAEIACLTDVLIRNARPA